MDELLKCPACMDRYALEGNKLPRVFMCGHSFCHSCILGLVRRENSVTCPTCHHKHKCNNVENLPRNLTLLQLLEFECSKAQAGPKKTERYCSACWENELFCEKCNNASDEAECRNCFKKKLWAKVSQLQKLLTQGKKSCEQNPALINNHLTKCITEFNASASLEYGLRVEMNELCDAFNDAVNANHKQDVTDRQQAVSRFLTFHEMAEIKLNEVRVNLKKDVVTCSDGYALTTLSNECALHLNCLEETWNNMLQSQHVTDNISRRLSDHQVLLMRKCEKQVWENIWQTMMGHSVILKILAALLEIWITVGFLTDWACPVQKSYGGVCYIFMALTGRFPIIFVTFVFVAINSVVADLHTAPPPHILIAIRREVATVIGRVVRHLSLNLVSNFDRYRY